MALPPIGSLSQVSQLSSLQSLSNDQSSPSTPAAGFGRVLQGMLEQNSAAQAQADDAVRAVATGEAQDLHTLGLAVVKADLSFRLILQLRNRLADAYTEVTRMQV